MGRNNKMLELLKAHETDEDLIHMIAELRDNFLDHNKMSEKEGYDISDATVTCPSHVIYYAALYIDYLEKNTK